MIQGESNRADGAGLPYLSGLPISAPSAHPHGQYRRLHRTRDPPSYRPRHVASPPPVFAQYTRQGYSTPPGRISTPPCGLRLVAASPQEPLELPAIFRRPAPPPSAALHSSIATSRDSRVRGRRRYRRDTRQCACRTLRSNAPQSRRRVGYQQLDETRLDRSGKRTAPDGRSITPSSAVGGAARGPIVPRCVPESIPTAARL